MSLQKSPNPDPAGLADFGRDWLRQLQLKNKTEEIQRDARVSVTGFWQKAVWNQHEFVKILSRIWVGVF